MKNFFLLIALIFMFCNSSNAQIHLFLEEKEINLKDGRYSAWAFPVSFNLDEALDDLKEYCKNRSDIKMKKEGTSLVIAEKISIPSIVSKRGDLIGLGIIKEDANEIALCLRLGYDISINSKDWSVEMNNFRNYIKGFMSYHYEHSYAERIEVLEKDIKSTNKELSQNEKKILTINKKIEKLNEKIFKESDEVIINELKKEISALESDVQELSEPLPELNAQVENHNKEVSKLKNESHKYLTIIGAI